MFSRAQGRVGHCIVRLPNHHIPVTVSRYPERSVLALYGRSEAQPAQQIRSLSGGAPVGRNNKNYSAQRSSPTNRNKQTYRPFSTQKTMCEKLQGQEQCLVKSTTPSEPTIHALFEPDTSTWQYIVSDPASSAAVIIDPVLDYDRATQTITTHGADAIRQKVKGLGYKIVMILETHIHADHITASSYLQNKLAHDQGYMPPIGIGKRIEQVQNLFGERYGIAETEYKGVFGKRFNDDEIFKIGELDASVLHLPGHTPDHVGYKIGDNVFCGDSIFHADIGTARCDFPGGSARDMFHSGRRLLGLGDEVKIWTGHDYPPADRGGPTPYQTVRHHRQHNKHLMDGMTLEAYIDMRTQRDAQMAAPRLVHPSLQVNIRAGRLPAPGPSGYRLLHLPLNFQGAM
ncbi:beta-lactamase-like protein [Aspergillus varians]